MALKKLLESKLDQPEKKLACVNFDHLISSCLGGAQVFICSVSFSSGFKSFFFFAILLIMISLVRQSNL